MWRNDPRLTPGVGKRPGRNYYSMIAAGAGACGMFGAEESRVGSGCWPARVDFN